MDDPYADRPWLRFYPEGVPRDVHVPDVPVTALLDDAARAFPDRPALTYFGRTLTYRELHDEVGRFAGVLAGLGVAKGDRVALVLPNCPQNVIAFFATLRLGAVAVQHNPLYTEPELRHQLADSGAIVAVVYDGAYARVTAVRPDTALQQVVVTSLVDYLPSWKQRLLRLPLRRAREKRARLVTPLPPGEDVPDFAELLAASTRGPAQTSLDPVADLAALQYTGGTTGLPKGAMLTHRNLVANAYQTRAWDPGISEGYETTLGVLPLFHVYGLTLGLMTTMLSAGRLVLMPTFDLQMVLEAVSREKPSIFPGVPPMYSQVNDAAAEGDHDLRSVRTCVSGAMRLPPATVDEFQQLTGGRLVEGYGLTETSPVALCNPLNRNARAGTVGLPVPSTDARVVDERDPDVVVPPGTAGELALRGPQVFAGYWGHAGDTAAMLRDGWILTGDVVTMSPDGFFTIIDRKRDVILASGFSIFPSEVEDAVCEHPDIAECVVVGVPDPYRGETVKAYVVPRPGTWLVADQVQDHCAERLAAYKVPKLVEVRDELPRNIIGKPLRRVLREQHMAAVTMTSEAMTSDGLPGLPC
ncbi:MAG TPA: AMP-binding protein [Actinomycetes bacterium]